jgi:hypothetical protein
LKTAQKWTGFNLKGRSPRTLSEKRSCPKCFNIVSQNR